MTLIGLIVVLVLVGAGLYLLHAVVPIDERVKKIIDVVVLIVVLLWVLEQFGLIGGAPLTRHLR